MINRKITDALNDQCPALKLWIPCKEVLGAGNHKEVTELTAPYRMIDSTAVNIDKAVAHAIRAGTGSDGVLAATGLDGVTAGLGNIAVPATHSFIALAVLDKSNSATSFAGLGRSNGTDTLLFASAGKRVVSQGGVDLYTSVQANVAAASLVYVALNRDLNQWESNHTTTAGVAGALDTADASAVGALAFTAGVAINGLNAWPVIPSADAIAFYNVAVLVFDSAFPSFASLQAEMIAWAAAARAGNKYVLPFAWSLAA